MSSPACARLPVEQWRPSTRSDSAARAIAGFNDYPERTLPEVVALCAKVATLLRTEAGMNG